MIDPEKLMAVDDADPATWPQDTLLNYLGVKHD